MAMQGLSWGTKESLVGACGIQFLHWGSDPGPLRSVCSGILATGAPRKSQQLKIFFSNEEPEHGSGKTRFATGSLWPQCRELEELNIK